MNEEGFQNFFLSVFNVFFVCFCNFKKDFIESNTIFYYMPGGLKEISTIDLKIVGKT